MTNRRTLRSLPCGCSAWLEDYAEACEIHLAPCCAVHENDLHDYVAQYFESKGIDVKFEDSHDLLN